MFIYLNFLIFGYICNYCAGILQETMREKEIVTLKCNPPVGSYVTWSKEIDCKKVDIVTLKDGVEDKHIPDPGNHYGSTIEKSLVIVRLKDSDSGIYFCNSQPTIYLIVKSDNGMDFPKNNCFRERRPNTGHNNTKHVLVGVVSGFGVLLLTIIFIWRYCSKRRAVRAEVEGNNMADDAIYAVIKDDGAGPRAEHSTPGQSESIYHQAGFPGMKGEGTPKQSESPYVMLHIPQAEVTTVRA